LNPNGFILSKNWRSIRPSDCKFIAGIATTYGGFRRLTLLEAWQYLPSKNFNFSFNEIPLQSINWIIGKKGKWNNSEMTLFSKKIRNKEGVLIADNNNNLEKFRETNLKRISADKFIETTEKYDVIILDECKKVGGAIKLTVNLKTKISESLKDEGVAILKTYFNPVLEDKGLNLLSKSVICYENFEKINLITVYEKNKANIES
jgi:hypothetical protein